MALRKPKYDHSAGSPYGDLTDIDPEETDESSNNPEEESGEDSSVPLIASTTTETHGERLPPEPAAIQHYRDILAQEPLHQNYHPSKLRQILGMVGGVGMGLASANPGIGVAVNKGIRDAPYRGQLTDYQQRLAQAKTGAGIDAAAQAAQLKGGQELAAQYHLYRQGEAEVARKAAEQARQGHLQRQTDLLPPDAATAHQYKLDEISAAHPEKNDDFVLSHNADLTRAVIYNKKTGETRVEDYDPKTLASKLTGNLKEMADAQGIIKNGDPKSSEYAGAKLFLDNVKDQMNKRGTTLMIAPPQAPGEPQKSFRVGEGTKIPTGAQTTSGVNSENTETSTTRTMREAAPKVLALSSRTRQRVLEQVKSLGPAAGRWNELMTGKIGAPNPEFQKLVTDTTLLGTQLMRMHTGARGGEYIMKHFDKLLDQGKQSPENLIAALDEIDAYAKDLSRGGAAPEVKNESEGPKVVRGPDGKLKVQR